MYDTIPIEILKEQMVVKISDDNKNFDKNKLKKIQKKLETYINKHGGDIKIKDIYKISDDHKNEILSIIKSSKSGEELFNKIKNAISDDFKTNVFILLVIVTLLVLIKQALYIPVFLTIKYVIDAIRYGLKQLYQKIKLSELESIIEDDILSNPVDLNPEPCDNIDDRQVLKNRIDFMRKTMEDILMDDGDDPLNNKFGIDGITLTSD